MNNKENYINYIVDDIVKKTKIDFDRERLTLPFTTEWNSTMGELPSSLLPLWLYPPSLNFRFNLTKYVVSMYGIKDEEIEIIWELVRARILTLIDNG